MRPGPDVVVHGVDRDHATSRSPTASSKHSTISSNARVRLAEPDQRDREEDARPRALELGARGLGDGDRPLRRVARAPRARRRTRASPRSAGSAIARSADGPSGSSASRASSYSRSARSGESVSQYARPEHDPVGGNLGGRAVARARAIPSGSSCTRRLGVAVQPAEPPDPAHRARLLELVEVGQHALEQLGRLVERERALGLVGGREARGDGALGHPRVEQVPRDLDRRRAGRGERRRGTLVQALPARPHRVGVDRLLRERVPPRVRRRGAADLDDELRAERLLERELDDLLVGVGEPRAARRSENVRPRTAAARRTSTCASSSRPIAQQDRLAHGLRDPELLDRAPLPAPALEVHVAALDRLAQHLLDHERVALGALGDQVAELVGHLVGVEDRRDHLGDAERLQRGQRHRLREPRAAARPGASAAADGGAGARRAVGAEDERRHVLQPPREMVEQLARRRVGPVDVVDDEQHAAAARGRAEHGDDRLEEPQLRLRRIARRRRGVAERELREEQARARAPRRRARRGSPRGERPAKWLPSASTNGRYGSATSASEQLPQSTSQPSERARSASSCASRVLPIPASPASSTSAAAPVALDREQRVLERRELGVASDEASQRACFSIAAIVVARAHRPAGSGGRSSEREPHADFGRHGRPRLRGSAALPARRRRGSAPPRPRAAAAGRAALPARRARRARGVLRDAVRHALPGHDLLPGARARVGGRDRGGNRLVPAGRIRCRGSSSRPASSSSSRATCSSASTSTSLGETPFPSTADALYLLGYPVLAAGLWLLVRQRSTPDRLDEPDRRGDRHGRARDRGLGAADRPVHPRRLALARREARLDRVPARRRAPARGGGAPAVRHRRCGRSRTS